MKIRDLLNKDGITFSIEVFPPKKASGFETVRQTVEKIAELKPDFISVTYGAGGTTAGITMELADTIQNDSGVPVLPPYLRRRIESRCRTHAGRI